MTALILVFGILHDCFCIVKANVSIRPIGLVDGLRLRKIDYPVGLPEKKLFGFSMKPAYSTGITGKSSGLHTCV